MVASGSPDAIGRQEPLDLFEDPAIDYRLVLTRKPIPVMAGLAEIGPVLEKIGEGAVGKRDPADYLPGSRGVSW